MKEKNVEKFYYMESQKSGPKTQARSSPFSPVTRRNVGLKKL